MRARRCEPSGRQPLLPNRGDPANLVAVDGFPLQQGFREGVERRPVLLDAGFRGLVHPLDDPADLLLRLPRQAVAGAGDPDHADSGAHAPFGHHPGGDVGRMGDVARRAGCHLPGSEHHLFGGASAHGDDEIRLQLLDGNAEAVMLREPHDEAESLAVGNDGGAVHLVGTRNQAGAQGVPRLVDRHEPALFGRQHEGAPLKAHHDLVAGGLQMLAGDEVGALPRGEDRRLVDQVAEIRPGEAWRSLGDDGEIDARGEPHVAGVNIEDRLAAADVGQPHMDLPVESARAQEGRIEHVDPVGGADHDHAGGGVEAVHLDEKLVEGSLEFPVGRRSAAAALAADGVDLVDEDQAGRTLAGLLEQLGDPTLGDADERSREVAARHGQEGHSCLAGERLGDEGLAGSGRSDHQEPAGNAGAHLLEGLSVLKEGDHLL